MLAKELPAGLVGAAFGDGEDTATTGGGEELGKGEARVVCAVRCHGQTLAHAVAAPRAPGGEGEGGAEAHASAV